MANLDPVEQNAVFTISAAILGNDALWASHDKFTRLSILKPFEQMPDSHKSIFASATAEVEAQCIPIRLYIPELGQYIGGFMPGTRYNPSSCIFSLFSGRETVWSCQPVLWLRLEQNIELMRTLFARSNQLSSKSTLRCRFKEISRPEYSRAMVEFVQALLDAGNDVAEQTDTPVLFLMSAPDLLLWSGIITEAKNDYTESTRKSWENSPAVGFASPVRDNGIKDAFVNRVTDFDRAILR